MRICNISPAISYNTYKPIQLTMSKTLIVYRLYDPTYGPEGNSKTLSVVKRDDNTLDYSYYGGWQSNGCGFSISNMQLKRSLPLSVNIYKNVRELHNEIASVLATGVGSHYISRYDLLNDFAKPKPAPKPKAKSNKLWIGHIPGIYGYGVMVVEFSEEAATKALKKAFALAKKYNDGEMTYPKAFDYWGGRIFEVEVGKHYGDDFSQ